MPPDDDDRLPEAAAHSGPAGSHGSPQWPNLVVPDDIRSLDADIRAYHRELRSRRRQQRWARLFGRRWQQYGLPGSIIAFAMLVAVGVALSLTVLTPRASTQQPRPAPVATDAARPVGQVGGLLPDLRVGIIGTDMRLRDVRPAVLALVPPRCDCIGTLENVAGEANEYAVPLIIVGTKDTSVEAQALSSAIRRGRTNTVYDANGALATTYAASGVTLLLVARDATVTDIVRSVARDIRLEAQLSAMLSPAIRSQPAATRAAHR